MLATEEKHEKKSWLLSGATIALISAAAYLVTFLYEYGYTQFFEIPPSLIELTLTQVFVSFVGLCFTFIVYFMILKTILSLQSASWGNVLHLIIVIQLHYLLLFLIVSLLWGGFRPWVIFGLVTLYFLFDDFVYPLIIQRGTGTYREKILAQQRLEAKRPSITKMILGPAKDSREASFLLPISFFVLLSLPAGRYTARSKSYFYVLSDSTDVALLKIYGDKVISAPFDRKAKEISRSLTIQTLSKQGQLKLSYEKIGPLKVRKNKDR